MWFQVMPKSSGPAAKKRRVDGEGGEAPGGYGIKEAQSEVQHGNGKSHVFWMFFPSKKPAFLRDLPLLILLCWSTRGYSGSGLSNYK